MPTRYLIHLYGVFWNPDTVDWGAVGAGNRGTLKGRVKTQSGASREVDFWNARGIYALYDNFRLIYVGQVMDQALGARLRQHLTDRFGGRWDMCSWYAASSLREHTVRNPGGRQLESVVVVNTLEAILISATDPPLNRKRNTSPGAGEAKQVASPRPQTVRHYLEQLTEQAKKLDGLEAIHDRLVEIEDQL
jgi:hypothetical protein